MFVQAWHSVFSVATTQPPTTQPHSRLHTDADDITLIADEQSKDSEMARNAELETTKEKRRRFELAVKARTKPNELQPRTHGCHCQWATPV